MLAGGGIAIAALGSSLAFITKTLAGLAWWQIAYGLGAAVVAVLAPTQSRHFTQRPKLPPGSRIAGEPAWRRRLLFALLAVSGLLLILRLAMT